MALQVGQPAPDFCLESHQNQLVRLSTFRGSHNVVLVFFPLAWTPIWTGQIPSYQVALDRFAGVKTQVLGLSVDSVPCLNAWAESLGGITYPLLSDFFPHGGVAQQYGLLRKEGYSERAIFVIDKRGIIRYIDIHDIDEQPDNEVLFKVLEELEPAHPGPQANPAPSQEHVVPDADVVLYCTPWCPECRRVRAYFKEHAIPYVEVDISKDRVAARQVREWAGGFETTPTFNLRGKLLTHFDPAALERYLGIKNK